MMLACNTFEETLLTYINLPAAAVFCGAGRMCFGRIKSEFYQDKADEFRAVASKMRLTNARLQLLWMARQFERLAERMRGREQERQAAD